MSAARQLGSHPTTAERLDRALELIAAHEARLAALEANAPDPEAVIALAAALAEMQTDIRTLQAGQQKSPDARGYASLQDAAHAVGLSCECVRLYALAGKVVAERRRGRWFIAIESLKNFLK